MPAMKDWNEIREWRQRTRKQLIDWRVQLAAEEREKRAQLARERLTASVDFQAYRVLGIYWPIRGEIDVRELAAKHIATGGLAALPVVVREGAPVEFWRWTPDMTMKRGIWNIPIPVQREVLQPDILIAPLVGFDEAGYRLGYGGGYYDRTIAAAPSRPYCVGLGFADTGLQTIYPQPHDMPMDVIVTEQFIRSRPRSAESP